MHSEQLRLVTGRSGLQIEPLIPPHPVWRGTGWRSRINARAALEGVLFRLDNGWRWRHLPGL